LRQTGDFKVGLSEDRYNNYISSNFCHVAAFKVQIVSRCVLNCHSGISYSEVTPHIVVV
jgi:hypothetical protein